jgi:hypothetical protein
MDNAVVKSRAFVFSYFLSMARPDEIANGYAPARLALYCGVLAAGFACQWQFIPFLIILMPILVFLWPVILCNYLASCNCLPYGLGLVAILFVMRFCGERPRYLSGQITIVLQYVLFMPLITLLAYTWHPLLRNKYLTPTQARVWTMFNMFGVLFGIPIAPVIYTWIESCRKKVRVSGCLDEDHLSEEDKYSLAKYLDEPKPRRNIEEIEL